MSWLLVVARGPLVGLLVCEPTGFGEDFLVDLLSRHGGVGAGVEAKVVLVVQDCQALGCDSFDVDPQSAQKGPI